MDCFALNSVNFLSKWPASSENDHVVLKRPAPRAQNAAKKLRHCIPPSRGQLALCTLSNQSSKPSIERRLKQPQPSLYRWVTWGSERLKTVFKVTLGQFLHNCNYLSGSGKAAGRRLSFKGRCGAQSLKKDKDQAGASQISCLYSQILQTIDNFLFVWKLETARQGENSNEVTDELFIGSQPPYSDAFQLRWILNVIFFLQLHPGKLVSEKEIIEFNNISCDTVIFFATVLATFTTYSSGLIGHKQKRSHILSCPTDFFSLFKK